MAGNEVPEAAERTAWREDALVGRTFMHGEYCERINQPAMEQPQTSPATTIDPVALWPLAASHNPGTLSSTR